MQTALAIAQIVVAILLTVVILLQQKGAGLGAGFGGSGGVQTTRRGVDKKLHQATIVISVIFFTLALVQVVI